MKKQMPGMF